MKTFFNVEDLGDLKAALAEAQDVKANRFGYQELGKNKTLLMIFFLSLIHILRHVSTLPSPLGKVLKDKTLENGLHLQLSLIHI